MSNKHLKMHWFSGLLFVLSIVLQACGGSSQIYIVENEYKGKTIQHSVMGYCLQRSELNIMNSGTVSSSLGSGDPYTTFFNYFDLRFPVVASRFSTASTITSLRYGHELSSDSGFYQQDIRISRYDTISMVVPKKHTNLFGDIGFIIFFEKVKLFDGNKNSYDNMPNIGNIEAINFECRYVIWDVANSRSVKQGKIQVSNMSSFDGVDKEDWDSLIADLGKEIFQHTPFFK